MRLDELEDDIDEVIREIGKLDGVYTKVGYLERSGDVEYGGAAESKSGKSARSRRGLTKAALALIQDQGSVDANVPSRPFMQMAFDDNINEIEKKTTALFDKVAKGEMDEKQALFILGEWFAGEIKETIRNGNFEPLSQYTIDRKNSTEPLIDTGLNLLGGVEHEEVL